MFIAALCIIAKMWKHLRCPLTDEWKSKMWLKKKKNQKQLFSLKRKEILTCATARMNLEDVMLGEINQSQKDKYCMIPFIYLK